MLIDSDKILTPETDETVYVRQVKINDINETLKQQLFNYIKSKKCAIWAYLCKIETLNSKFEVFEKAHYCLVIKPDKKFNYSRDPQALFDIMQPFLNENDFVDVSIKGWLSTIQFDFIKEDSVEIYSIF